MERKMLLCMRLAVTNLWWVLRHHGKVIIELLV